MADKWPLANGNWSNDANWNGGTKPVDGDNIYADNRTITIDQDINLPNSNLFTTARSGGTAGGQFSLSGAWNLTCLSINPGSTLCIGISANYTGTITCPTVNPSATVSVFGISVSGGTSHAFSIINANFYSGPAAGRSAFGTLSVSSGTITLINCTAHCTATNVANCISHGATGGLIIQGTCNLVQASASGNSLLGGSGANTYNLTGTISAGGNGTLITAGAGQTVTYSCTAFAWNSVIPTGNSLFVCSTTGGFTITLPDIVMHNHSAGPIIMNCNTSGAVANCTVNVTAGIATLFITSGGGRIVHSGTIVCNDSTGAAIAAPVGSMVIVDKIQASPLGGMILQLNPGVRFKSTSAIYGRDINNNPVNLIVDGGVLDLPIAANVRSGVTYNNGTQTGTMIDHDARFDAIDDEIFNLQQDLAGVSGIAAKFDTMIILDEAVWQFTGNALELGPSGGGGGLDAAGVRAAVGLASANLDTQINTLGSTLVSIEGYIDTEVSAIKAKTDQLAFTVPNQVDANALTGGGGGGLDAAGVRAAVGLASANLDTQINTLGSTLVSIEGYIDTEVSAIKAKTDQLAFTIPNQVDANALTGGGGGGGGGTGTGARTVTITVNLSDAPLEGATVRLTKGAESFIGTTNVSGQVVFNINDGTWAVAITASGASFAGASLVVDGNEAATYSMTLISPPTSTLPNAATGTYLCVDSANATQSGVKLFRQLIRGPGQSGVTYDSPVIKVVSGNDGNAYFTNLIRGATYRVWRNYEAASSNAVEFVVPATGESFPLPEIL